ncbi:MAG: hypothetical protein MHMPM18_003020 [Marteilia pararefringens]
MRSKVDIECVQLFKCGEERRQKIDDQYRFEMKTKPNGKIGRTVGLYDKTNRIWILELEEVYFILKNKAALLKLYQPNLLILEDHEALLPILFGEDSENDLIYWWQNCLIYCYLKTFQFQLSIDEDYRKNSNQILRLSWLDSDLLNHHHPTTRNDEDQQPPPQRLIQIIWQFGSMRKPFAICLNSHHTKSYDDYLRILHSSKSPPQCCLLIATVKVDRIPNGGGSRTRDEAHRHSPIIRLYELRPFGTI